VSVKVVLKASTPIKNVLLPEPRGLEIRRDGAARAVRWHEDHNGSTRHGFQADLVAG